MAEPVVLARGDDHHLRDRTVEEGLSRGRAGSMVRGFENRTSEPVVPSQERVIRLPFHIAGQQDRDAAVFQPEHDGAVVRAVGRATIRGHERRGGMKDHRADATQSDQAVARGHAVGDDPAGGNEIEQPVQQTGVAPLPRLQQVPDLELLRHVNQPSEVIVVRMGEDDRVQPLYPSVSEKRCENPRARIETLHSRTAVHQHCPAVGELHEDRVALTHVEEDDLQAIAIPEDPPPYVDVGDDQHEEECGLSGPDRASPDHDQDQDAEIGKEEKERRRGHGDGRVRDSGDRPYGSNEGLKEKPVRRVEECGDPREPGPEGCRQQSEGDDRADHRHDREVREHGGEREFVEVERNDGRCADLSREGHADRKDDPFAPPRVLIPERMRENAENRTMQGHDRERRGERELEPHVEQALGGEAEDEQRGHAENVHHIRVPL